MGREREDSDDGDPCQAIIPSQEQADDIHLIGKPTENQAIISEGRELRKLVENNGTNLHWVKVKGRSGDVINDKADELATIGMHGKDQHGRNRSPRQLKYRQIVSHHYDKAEESKGGRQKHAQQKTNEKSRLETDDKFVISRILD